LGVNGKLKSYYYGKQKSQWHSKQKSQIFGKKVTYYATSLVLFRKQDRRGYDHKKYVQNYSAKQTTGVFQIGYFGPVEFGSPDGIQVLFHG